MVGKCGPNSFIQVLLLFFWDLQPKKLDFLRRLILAMEGIAEILLEDLTNPTSRHYGLRIGQLSEYIYSSISNCQVIDP